MRKTPVKLIVVALLTSFLFVTLFAGCGTASREGSQDAASTISAATGGGADSSTTAEPAAAKIKIRIMTRWTGSDANAPALQQIEKDFQANNPDIELVDESVADETAYTNKMKAEVATGDIPHIFQVTSETHDYAKNGIIADLKPIFDEDKAWSGGFLAGMTEPGTIGSFPDLPGKYVLPMEEWYETFFYNTELFSKAGIANAPATYEEFLNDIKKLKDAGITPIGSGAKDAWRMEHLFDGIWLKQLGIEKADGLASGKVKFTDPDVIDAFKQLKNLVDIGAFDKNMASIDYANENSSFLAGKSAMKYDGTWFVGNITGTPVADKIKTFSLPTMSDHKDLSNIDLGAGDGFALSNLVKDDAEKAAMIKVAKYISGPEANNLFLTLAKRPVVRTDVTATVDDPILSGIMEQHKNTLSGTVLPNYTLKAKMANIIDNNLVAMVLGSKTPEEAAKAVQDEMEKD